MLTKERRIILLERLKEAETALHQCSLGQTVRVFVDQTGERVEYGPASVGALNKYIYALKIELGAQVAGPALPWM